MPAVPGHEWVRQQLGWATEPEGGYSSFYQCNAALGDAGRCYLGTPRGEIIVFTKGSGLFWSFFKGSTIANVPPPKLPGKLLCATSAKDFVIFKADGSGMFPRTTNFVGFSGFSFSPDGKRIVFVLIRDSQSGLYLMNADGSGQALTPNTKAEDARPSWSPDGLKLPFHSVQANSTTTPAIFIINADGAGRTQLTLGYDLNPVWSPDKRLSIQEPAPGHWPGASPGAVAG